MTSPRRRPTPPPATLIERVLDVTGTLPIHYGVALVASWIALAWVAVATVASLLDLGLR